MEVEYPSGEGINMKFRLPMTGKSLIYMFGKNDTISRLFDYINCFGRDEFEDKYADFDLTQTFPRLSLIDKKSQTISDLFPDSEQ